MIAVVLIIGDGNGGWYTPTSSAAEISAAGFPMPRDLRPTPRETVCCGEEHYPSTYICTEASGHTGFHAASNGREVLARWKA